MTPKINPKTHMQVTAIKNGTVLDHLASGAVFEVMKILNLDQDQKIITVGINFPSQLLGRKDFIKVEDWEITPEQASRVAIFAPQATVNIIKNYQLEKKFKVKTPDHIDHLIICPSPKCITHHEKVESYFYVQMDGRKPKFQCKYCEKVFSQEEIREYRL